MAGYSSTPLIKKLGLKETDKVILINQPVDYYQLLGIKEGSLVIAGKAEAADFVHIFAKGSEEYINNLLESKKRLKKDGMIWISWPKKASKILTDLTENIIRDIALANGLVDVKVCAVDDTWSGLKLVYRLKDR